MRSAGGSPKNAADHYGYLLMDLCQQHKERRSRPQQSASLPASPASISTGKAPTVGVARAGACVTAANAASSMQDSGGAGYHCSPAYGPAESAASPGICPDDCRPLPPNAAVGASVLERRSREYTAGHSTVREASCGACLRLQSFLLSSSTSNNGAGCENSSSSRGLAGRDENLIDAATANGRKILVPKSKGCEFLLGTPRHQMQKQQQTLQHRQQQLPEQLKDAGAKFTAETQVRRSRQTQREEDATATVGLQPEGKDTSTLRNSDRSPACDSQCTCSKTCSNPCGGALKSTPDGGACVHPLTPRVLHGIAYNGATSKFACNRRCVTECSDGIGEACPTTSNTICVSHVYNASPTFCCKNTCSAASESVRWTRGGVDVLQEQSCSSTTRHDYQEASGERISAAHEENELEYYMCSAADDRVGRYCENGCKWGASFAHNYHEVYTQNVRSGQKTKSGDTSPPRSISREVWRCKEAEVSNLRPSAPTQRSRQQPTTPEDQFTATRLHAHNTEGASGVNEKEGRKEAGEEYMLRTQTEKIPSEGGYLDEQHHGLISKFPRQEGIRKSSSIYDNELEMYEHHNVDVWVCKYTGKTTSQVTSLGAEPKLYQESPQQKSLNEDKNYTPEPGAFRLLNSCLSSSSDKHSPAARTKGTAGKVTAPASRSTSVSRSTPRGSHVAGNPSGNSKSSVACSPGTSLDTAKKATKRSATSSAVILTTSAARVEAGLARDAAEQRESARNSNSVTHRAPTQGNSLELDEVPNSEAAAAVPDTDPRRGCASFFGCLSPRRKRRSSSSRASTQSQSINIAAKQAVRCFPADTPRSSAVVADTLDSCHLHAEKVFRPEAAAAASLEATTLSATFSAAAAAADAAINGAAVETRIPSAAQACRSAGPGAQDGTVEESDSHTERDPYDELEAYEYKTNHCLEKMENSFLLEKDETSTATGFRKLCWSHKEQYRVDAATAAYTIVQTSPSESSCMRSGYSEYGKQYALALSRHQGSTASHRNSVAAQQRITEAPAGQCRGQKSEPCCGTSSSSSLPATVHTSMGVTQHCCKPQAVKHWLLKQKVWGACHACGTYQEPVAAGSQNSCDVQRFWRGKDACSQVASPRVLYKNKREFPSPTWPPAGDTAAPGAVSLLSEATPRQQLQSLPPWGEQKSACTSQQTFHKREGCHGPCVHPQGQRDIFCPILQQQGYAERQRLTQHQQQRQPQRQQQGQGQLDQRHEQHRRGRKQQQSIQQTGGSALAACEKRHVEDIFPTGRRDWHVAAYEDAVELKRKRHDFGNDARSRSSSTREQQTAAGGRGSPDRSGQAYRHAPSAAPVTRVASVDMPCDISPCFPGGVNGVWLLQPDHTASSGQQENTQQFFRQQDDTQHTCCHDVGKRRTLLQERQPGAHMSHAPKTHQHLSDSALQRQESRSDAINQYPPGQQQQQDGNHVLQPADFARQPQVERDVQAEDACVAPYPLHTYHHLKQRDCKEIHSRRNRTSLPPAKTASPLFQKETSDECRDMGNKAHQKVHRTGEQRQQEQSYRSSAVGGTKGLLSACDSVNIDSCRVQGETNRNSEAQSYLSVAETLIYDKQPPHNRSPVPCSSLALSPASPSEQEASLPLGGAQQATFSSRELLNQEEEVQERRSHNSDVCCNTTLLHQVACCRQRQQYQQREQLVQDQLAQHDPQREVQRQQQEHPTQQHQLQRQRKQQAKQQLLYGEYGNEASSADRRNREKHATDGKTHEISRPPVVALKCTSPVTPTSQGRNYHGRKLLGASIYCFAEGLRLPIYDVYQ